MTKTTFTVHKLKLTDAQLKNLAMGKNIMLKPEHMDGSGDGIVMTTRKASKIHTALSKGKGMRLALTPEEMMKNEIEITGEGINFKKIGRFIRKGAKAVGKIYRENVRPYIKEGLRNAIETGVKTVIPKIVETGLIALGQPELAAAIAPEIESLGEKASKPTADFIAKKTGAFGIKKAKATKKTSCVPPKRVIQPPHPKFVLYDDDAPFIRFNTPAGQPVILDQNDNSGAGLFIQGQGLFRVGAGLYRQGQGIFRSVGSGLFIHEPSMGRGMVLDPIGTAENPLILDQNDNPVVSYR